MTEMSEAEIRADERRKICRAEGHLEVERTSLGDVDRQVQCGRCGERWTEPFGGEVSVEEAARVEAHFGMSLAVINQRPELVAASKRFIGDLRGRP